MRSAREPRVECWNKLIGNIERERSRRSNRPVAVYWRTSLAGCYEGLHGKDCLVCDELPNRIKDCDHSRGVFIRNWRLLKSQKPTGTTDYLYVPVELHRGVAQGESYQACSIVHILIPDDSP